MHIALVTDYYLPTLGGVQTVVKAHRESLEADGHAVTVFSPLTDESTDAGLVGLPTARGFAPDGYPFTWPPSAASATLRGQFRDRGIDVVHVHSEMFAALAAYRAAGELGLPIVQTMHGRIDVYTRSVLPFPALTTPLLARMHARHIPHEPLRADSAHAPYLRDRASRRMWQLMTSQANAADHVVVPSAHFATKLEAQGVRTPLTVLSNGLEESVLAAAGPASERTVHADEPLRVMWCGRLSPEKRPEVFLDAVARTPGIAADIYGDGVSRAAIARRARQLPPGRATVHGPVPQTEVLAAMRRAHVFVSSSYDFDNQPMVLLEAAATGLPVIVTDPDLAEVIPPGGGRVTSTPDAEGLAMALAELRDSPQTIARMSSAASANRRAVAQDSHRTALLAVYEAAIRRRSTPATDGRTNR